MLWARVAMLGAVVASGCGRVGFEAVADGTPSDSLMGDFTAVSLPAGGVANGIVVADSPTTLFAQFLARGVFRSTDGGVTWTECSRRSVAAIAWSAGMLYAAGGDDVYVSTDHCASWQPLGLGAQTFAVLPVGAKVYAGTATDLVVYDGTSWATVPTTRTGSRVRTIASAGAVLLVGTDTGVTRSSNGGAAWTTQNQGLGGLQVNAIAIAPSDPSRVYASHLGSAIARSVDGGLTWTEIHNPGATSFAIDPVDADQFFAAEFEDLLVSQNGGASFTSARTPIMDAASPRSFAFDGAGGLYVGTSRGVFFGALPVVNWVARNEGLDAWLLRRFAAADGGNTFWGTDGGMLRSDDGGRSYSVDNSGFATTAEIMDVVTPTATSVITSQARIHVSTNGGQSYAAQLTAGAANNFRIPALTSSGTRVIAGTRTQTLYADSPWVTWTARQIAGASHDVRDLAAGAGAIYAAVDVGVYVSTDNGVTYMPVAGGPADPQHVWLTSDGVVLVAAADGLWGLESSTWSRRGFVDDLVEDMLVRPGVWIAVTKTRVASSRDGGGSWEDLRGLEARWPHALGVDVDGNLLVGTLGYGLYRTAFP